MEAWTPESVGPDVACRMLALAGKAVPESLPPNTVNGDTVHGAIQLGVLSARSAVPHVDADFAPWSALWILRAGEGHRLSMADHVPSGTTGIGRVPTKKPSHHVDLSQGDVVLFHAHRLHWLRPASDDGIMVAVSIDFERRPDRDEVEGRLRGIAVAYGLLAPDGPAPR